MEKRARAGKVSRAGKVLIIPEIIDRQILYHIASLNIFFREILQLVLAWDLFSRELNYILQLVIVRNVLPCELNYNL